MEQQQFYDRFTSEMGTAENLDLQGPSHDAAFKKWWARFERLGASPGTWRELAEILGKVDVRSVLEYVQAPTLVLHRRGDRISDVGQGRAIAERIPGARFVQLEGDDHIPILADSDAIVDEIEEFLTGARSTPEPDRMLATVLFTDIVGSTKRAAERRTVTELGQRSSELSCFWPVGKRARTCLSEACDDAGGVVDRFGRFGRQPWVFRMRHISSDGHRFAHSLGT